MRSLTNTTWRRQRRLARTLDYLAVGLACALIVFFVSGWLLLAMKLDCEHPELNGRLHYCQFFRR